MSAYAWEWLIAMAYVLAGPFAWGAFTFFAIKARQRMNLLAEPCPTPAPAPLASILIPVKDEEVRIAESVNSAIAQDYPNFEVIAIDDRSVDRTGAILDDLAVKNPHLRVMHIEKDGLPDGWTGKCNALHRGVKLATGKWLLFVDSDVILAPDALRKTLALAEKKEYDMVSLLPHMEAHTFWEGLLIPLCCASVGAMYMIALTNVNEVKTAFANGQYLMISRRVYDAVGGHETVRDRFCEDVEIARVVKNAGYRPRLTWGVELAAVRMYSSLKSVMRGWSRNFFACGVGSPWRIITALLFVLFCTISIIPAAIWGVYRNEHPVSAIGGWGWLAAVAFHAIGIGAFISFSYHLTGNKRSWAFLFPLGLAVLCGIFFRSLWMCITGKVEWRGTKYTHRMTPLVPKRA